MNGELDPRVQELCAQIQSERDQARMFLVVVRLGRYRLDLKEADAAQ